MAGLASRLPTSPTRQHPLSPLDISSSSARVQEVVVTTTGFAGTGEGVRQRRTRQNSGPAPSYAESEYLEIVRRQNSASRSFGLSSNRCIYLKVLCALRDSLCSKLAQAAAPSHRLKLVSVPLARPRSRLDSRDPLQRPTKALERMGVFWMGSLELCRADGGGSGAR